MKKRLLLALAMLALPAPALAANADTIYFGGPIITINDAAPSAEAVAVKGGLIVAVGSKAAVLAAEKGAATRLVNLAGHTMIPGFVDSHGHLTGVGLQAMSANLLPPPDGPAQSIADIQRVMRDYIATSAFVKDTGVAIGFDYDDSQLAEKRHPNRHELDAISTTLPILLIHQSGHLAVMNSKALALAGVTADTPNPPGGVIQREADGKTPNGVLEETAHFMATLKILPKFTQAQKFAMFDAAQDIYARYGFTTVQDGATQPDWLATLIAAAKAGRFKLDIVAYPELTAIADNPEMAGVSHNYTNNFRIGGVKMILDGSPQGRTAWFSKPYFQPPEGQKADYAGYPAYPDPADVDRWFKLAYKNNWQLMAHANGDAAIQQMIDSTVAAEKAYPGQDRRTICIHCQFIRPDQLPQIKAAKIFPSLFPMHSFYWGDWHREVVVGPDRAAYLSPTGDMLKLGIRFGIHHDAPVTFPNSMRVLDSAINRTTRSGFVLGPDQRLEPIIALKAMTIWPAYQYFEESSKGSIEVGKRADLVILDHDPLTVPRATIKDIKIIETIKDGTTVYSAGG